MQHNTGDSRQRKRRILFTELEVLLYEYDLAGINFGSNPDEYAPEVRAIYTRLNLESTEEEMQSITYEIFVNYFSKLCVPPKDDPVYTELSREMWILWQRYIKQGLAGPSVYDYIA